MSKNIDLLNVVYSDVPSVQLPQAGGGTAEFYDVSDTTAAASDVAAGKYFYTASGQRTAGTGSGGGGEIQTEATIESGVIFIDYTGEIVDEWPTSDVAGKSALPNNPSHSRLTAQGWNWTLTDIKTYISDHAEALLAVGQMYTTASGSTEIDVSLSADTLSPYLKICVNGTISVDWGDGSATNTITGTSLTTVKYQLHNYATAGDYTIKITATSGSYQFYATGTGNDNAGNVLTYTTSQNYSWKYSGRVMGIYAGSGLQLGQCSFVGCCNMKYLTLPHGLTTANQFAFNNAYGLVVLILPDTITTIGQYACNNCNSIKYLSLPNSLTSIGGYCFRYNFTVKAIAIPDSVTTLSEAAFYQCYSARITVLPKNITTLNANVIGTQYYLQSVKVPASVTSMKTRTFYNNRSLMKIRFSSSTPPTASASDVFSGISTFCVISVPVGSLSSYTSKSNYPNSSTYTYIEEA